ncbi:MAG: NUDIX hydrolase [Thermoplasmata archaeon]|nr:NUDIX hydrolase [Thermoplasmata archaeon]
MEYFEREREGVNRYLRYGRAPALTVDGVIFSMGRLLLIRRRNEPFKGMYALPGGFVEYGERTEDAVLREIFEETGLRTRVTNLIGVYSDPDRDPRGHTVSAIYLLEVVGGEMREGDDAAGVEMVDPEDLPPLAFDHEKVVKDALQLFEGERVV